MRRTRSHKPHFGGLSGATTERGTASVVPWMTMLFLVHSNFVLATHTVFLETNMKEAWTVLLSAGSSSSNSSSSGGGGAREIVDTMLADCHGRKSEGWGAECDRALYLETVLKKIDSSSSAGSIFATGAGATAEDTQQQQQVALDSAANEIAVIYEAELPFSAFFHEYAVPRRPVAILSGGGGVGGSGKPADAADGKEQGDLGDQAMDTAQQDGEEENGQQRVQDLILSGIESCLPHSVDPALGTVDGPLRACHDSLLESLPIPRYASEDFVQRFRGQDVLPVGEHAEVERFVSGWQRIHRTRPGAYTPPTACPAGANTLITVMSGTLQVLVYSSADKLPSLKPTFGNAPCPPVPSRTSAGDDGDSKSSKSEGDEHENNGDEERFDVDNGTGEEKEREEHRSGSGHAEETTTSTVLNPTREPLEEGFGLERTVADQQKQNFSMESSLNEARVKDETEDTSSSAKKEEPQTLDASDNTSNGHRRYSHHPSESHYWPHEPKYCADVWREDSEDNSIVTRYVVIALRYTRRAVDINLPFWPTYLEVPPYHWRPRLLHVDVNAIFAVHKVLGLTLPTLDKPRVTACERTACTVEWTSSFVKQGQDQTRLGFNLSFVPAATTNASSNAAGHGSRGGGYMEASGPGVFAPREDKKCCCIWHQHTVVIISLARGRFN
ncbi:unnamed protein product [Ectocarpus sp. CCAP 1310/34]|nr:unnamed protein product [Ectocarpus sp. CCAP 1310/34]